MDKYCLIGKRLPHSFSKLIHNSLGLDYSLVELEDETAVKSFVRDNPYSGYNVTIPYKQTVMPLLDELDGSAVSAGAVNTVVKRGGKSIGYNTDTEGMAAGLAGIGANLCGRKVMILGSGGTSSMAAALAKRQRARETVIVSRGGATNYGNYGGHADTEILINCTPVGMYPNNEGCPVELDKLPSLRFVFDAVYNPITTRLVAAAKSRGIAASGGLSMLVAQAIIAENLFLGTRRYDVEPQTAKTTAFIRKLQSNIVLVGMPSAGKSSVGNILAGLTDKTFIDTDAAIEKSAGCTIPEIFDKGGETLFREYEKRAVTECARGFGRVIATGGGAVLDADNRKELRQNAVVFWLVRDIDKLETAGRPLSKNINALETMAKNRYPLYNDVKDYIADGNAEISACAKEIKDRFDAHFSR